MVRARASSVDGRGVVWFRRDLRLDDNPAWAAATAAHREIVAIFVLESRLLEAAGDHRRDQLLGHVEALDAELRERGGALTVRSGPASDAIPALVAEVGATGLYFSTDFSPFATRRDIAVAEAVAKLAVPTEIELHHGLTVREPGSVLTQAGSLSKVFTPFYRRWSTASLTPWPEPGSGSPIVIDGLRIPSPRGRPRQEPGTVAAWNRLQRWLDDVDDYPATRDRPDLEGTSDLSADLKFGTLAARTVADVVGGDTEGRAAFVRQLAWRDWWAHTLAASPHLADRELRPEYRTIAWRTDEADFDAWCSGRTGFPVVDAGMRQLVATGWMHNRVRMICASFLVKDLLLDWRRGERFFRHHLVDADVAQNAGNWQWVAGTGPDAAPFFRIFNPVTQSRRFDPDGIYIRRWVPELADLETEWIHEPAAATPLDLGAGGVTLGADYPFPIVEHAAARERTLAAYGEALN